MSFWSSIGESFVNPLSSTSSLVSGGLAKGYLDNLGDTISSGISGAWDDYTGKGIAKKNLKFQQKQFDYQMLLNQQIQEREDNAMQRKVADLKAAGLNPVLAANGSGAAAQPLRSATAPQLGDYSGGIREVFGQVANAVFQALSMKKDFALKDAQIKLFQAEKDKVDAEAAGIKTENKYKDEWLSLRNTNQSLTNEDLQLNVDYARRTLDARVDYTVGQLTEQQKRIANAELDRILKLNDINIASIKAVGYRLDNDLKRQGIKLNDADLQLKALQAVKLAQENKAFKDKVQFWQRLGMPYDTPFTKDAALWLAGYTIGDRVLPGAVEAVIKAFSGSLTKDDVKHSPFYGTKGPFDRSYNHVPNPVKQPWKVFEQYHRADFGSRRNY